MVNFTKLEDVINSDVFRKLIDNHNILIDNVDGLNFTILDIQKIMGIPLSRLNTQNKSSLIDAINELLLRLNTEITGIGDLTQLSTETKINLVLAINETYAKIESTINENIGEWSLENREELVKPAIESIENLVGSVPLDTNSDTITGAINEIVSITETTNDIVNNFTNNVNNNTLNIQNLTDIVDKLTSNDVGPMPPESPTTGQIWLRKSNATLQSITAIGGDSWTDGINSGVFHYMYGMPHLKTISIFFNQDTQPTSQDINYDVSNDILWRFFWISDDLSTVKEFDRWQNEWIAANLNEFHIKTANDEINNPSQDRLFLLTVSEDYFTEALYIYNGTDWERRTVDVQYGEEWEGVPIPGDILYRPIVRDYYTELWSFIVSENQYVRVYNTDIHFQNHNELVIVSISSNAVGANPVLGYNYSADRAYFYNFTSGAIITNNEESQFNTSFGDRRVKLSFLQPSISDPYKLWVKTLRSAEPSVNDLYIWTGSEWESLGIQSRFKLKETDRYWREYINNEALSQQSIKNNYTLYSSSYSEVRFKAQNHLELIELFKNIKWSNISADLCRVYLSNNININNSGDINSHLPFHIYGDSFIEISTIVRYSKFRKVIFQGFLHEDYNAFIKDELLDESQWLIINDSVSMDEDLNYARNLNVQSRWLTSLEAKGLDGSVGIFGFEIVGADSFCFAELLFYENQHLFALRSRYINSPFVITFTDSTANDIFQCAFITKNNRGNHVKYSDCSSGSMIRNVSVSNWYTQITNSATNTSQNSGGTGIEMNSSKNIRVSDYGAYQLDIAFRPINSTGDIDWNFVAYKNRIVFALQESDYRGNSNFAFRAKYNVSGFQLHRNSSLTIEATNTNHEFMYEGNVRELVLANNGSKFIGIFNINVKLINNLDQSRWGSNITHYLLHATNSSFIRFYVPNNMVFTSPATTLNALQVYASYLSGVIIRNADDNTFVRYPSIEGGNFGSYALTG